MTRDRRQAWAHHAKQNLKDRECKYVCTKKLAPSDVVTHSSLTARRLHPLPRFNHDLLYNMLSLLNPVQSVRRMLAPASELNTNLPNNILLKVLSIGLMIVMAAIALTGNGGVVGLLHGISGVVVAIEGFYGVARYDLTILSRVIIYQACSIGVCLVIGIYSLSSPTICATQTGTDLTTCKAYTQLTGSVCTSVLFLQWGDGVRGAHCCACVCCVRDGQTCLAAGAMCLSTP